jgi:hypothetical protein
MLTVNTLRQSKPEYVIDESLMESMKFRRLMLSWFSERKASSSAVALASLPSYLKIIGMGKPAIPLILRQLKFEGNRPNHWFIALAVISEKNPVPEKSRGRMVEMANAWLEWGKSEGYV